MSGIEPPAAGPIAEADPWQTWRALTPARVMLGRTGASLPTREVLRFGHAHALARDAVHNVLDGAALRRAIEDLGPATVEVTSAATDRAVYLRRPDLGRMLASDGRARLEAHRDGGCDLVIVVADGLSATAVHANAAPLVAALLPGIAAAGWRTAPVVIATQARVALGDDIGAALGAKMAVMLIGERPGLSAADSLGAYLTFEPRRGRRDNERNCLSNIRAAGLSHAQAARSILWLATEAMKRGCTGIALKDESEAVTALAAGHDEATAHAAHAAQEKAP